MSKKAVSEKDFIKDISLLKDIEERWNRFSEIALFLNKTIFSVYNNQRYGGIIDGEVASKIKKDISRINLVKRDYKKEDYEKIVVDFKKVLNKFPFEEILANNKDVYGLKKEIKSFEDAKKLISEYTKFIEIILDDLDEFVSQIKIADKSDLLPQELLKRARENKDILEKITYDFSDRHVGEFIEELNALIKITLHDFHNLKKAKTVCDSKKIDLTQEGLLVHGTSDSIWHHSSIVKFIKKGLLPSKFLDRVDISIFPEMVSFTITINKRNFSEEDYEIALIIDPKYVSKNAQTFYYSHASARLGNKEDETFMSLCEKLGFKNKHDEIMKDRNNRDLRRKLMPKPGIDEFPHEVQSSRSVPFSAIIAAKVHKRFEYRMCLLMSKLSHRNPELTFPIYDKKNELLWPL